VVKLTALFLAYMNPYCILRLTIVSMSKTFVYLKPGSVSCVWISWIQ